jgi:arabinofuranosyltransferase
MSQRTIPRPLYFIPILLVGFFSLLCAEFQLDDALIYLRYIRNFHEGQGLVYNRGELFNGLTSPLFSYLVLISSYALDYQIANIAVSALFMIGAAIVGGLVFASSALEFIAITSLLSSISYFYLTFGMESAMFLFLIGLTLLLVQRSTELLWPVLALLVSTRSEGIFLAAPAAIVYLNQVRKAPRFSVIAVSVLIAATPCAINLWYYGSVFPDSSSAKIGQGRSGLWGEHLAFLHIGYMREWFFGGSSVSIGILVALSLVGALHTRDARITRLSIGFLVALAAFYIGLNIPGYHWYFAPFFFFFTVFIALGVTESFRMLFDGCRFSRQNLALAALLGAFVYAILHAVDFKPRKGADPYATIGRWIEANTPPDSSVGLIEVGTVGWFCKRRIIDILGLVSPYNSAYIADRNLYGWLRHYQPDYVLRHNPAWPHEQSITALERSALYKPVAALHVPGFVLLQRSSNASQEAIRALADIQRAP